MMFIKTEVPNSGRAWLVSGLAVDVHNAEIVAYMELARRLPPGFMLVDADFDLGEVAEEDIGQGQLALFVTARGYAAAQLNPDEARELVLGQPVGEARQRLMAELPLAEPPRIAVWPERITRVPLLPLRVSVEVVREGEPNSPLSLVR